MPSLELLQLLDRTHAFDPLPIPGYRSSLYVPFEELVGGRHEGRLNEQLRNFQRVALIGPIGSGKSSLVEYAIEAGGEAFAPIWVSAGFENEQTLTDPAEFARHLIREVVGWARSARQMNEDERVAALAEAGRLHPAHARRRWEGFSFRLALSWLEPGWSREVEETVADPEIERSRGDFVNSLDRLVDLIQESFHRIPVVIIDDSDRWLRLEDRARGALLERFFADTCRMLGERNWAIVMAIHPEYCAADAFRHAMRNGYLNSQLDLPRLAGPDQLRRLIDARVRARSAERERAELLEEGLDPGAVELLAEAHTDDVFEPGFEQILFDTYRANDANLRVVLTVVQQALRETAELGQPLVGTVALQNAALALRA